ncbi:MAG: sigma-54 dependent transcriptional regulator [Planctomycetota bacterium]|nr:sigma-54 dependent transcriptional regulator [Planctomycetota bacterium]
MSAHVLVVEDDTVARSLLVEVLEAEGHVVVGVESAEAALAAAARSAPHVLVTDVRMDGIDGIELMRRLKGKDPALQTIVVTAFGSLETAVEAIQSGAFDYLSKPFAMEEVSRMVRRALESRRTTGGASIERGAGARRMVGRSASITEVYKAVARVAPLNVAVLIRGETGAGKELVARAIHDAGPRAGGPYVAINCPSLPEGLLESELFGHVRGSFTGATHDRAGLFEAAEGGTILLDEIGDMPPPLQAKLLRVLETSEVRRVGSSSSRRVDARVLAATHFDLDRAVRDGAFREDLLYRLNAVTIEVPPLRERREDIPLLIDHFLDVFAQEAGKPAPHLPSSVIQALTAYSWPGNVRELAHVIERAVAMARGPSIDLEDLPSVVRHGGGRRDSPETALRTLDDVEKAHILSVLKSVDGGRRRAADILGIDRKTLYRKLQKYGLPLEPESETSA